MIDRRKFLGSTFAMGLGIGSQRASTEQRPVSTDLDTTHQSTVPVPAERECILREVNFDAEIATIHTEIGCLRNECLPALFHRRPSLGDRNRDIANNTQRNFRKNWSGWHQATFDVADALPLKSHALGRRLPSKNLEELCKGIFYPEFTICNQRIQWELGVFMPVGLGSILKNHAAWLKSPVEASAQTLINWLTSLPVDDPRLWNGLCCLLPGIAASAPEFALEALTVDFWRRLISERSCCRATEQRLEKDEDWIDGLWFHHILNNAALHVAAALANHHFSFIPKLLKLPCRYGGYTSLMPSYLFSVLSKKVSVLHALAQDS